jgi:hypothetical protein
VSGNRKLSSKLEVGSWKWLRELQIILSVAARPPHGTCHTATAVRGHGARGRPPKKILAVPPADHGGRSSVVVGGARPAPCGVRWAVGQQGGRAVGVGGRGARVQHGTWSYTCPCPLSWGWSRGGNMELLAVGRGASQNGTDWPWAGVCSPVLVSSDMYEGTFAKKNRVRGLPAPPVAPRSWVP